MAEDLFRGGHRTEIFLRKKNHKVASDEEEKQMEFKEIRNLSCLLKMVVFILLPLPDSLFLIIPLSTSQARNTSESI